MLTPSPRCSNPICGKQIRITYGGKEAYATVQDECPTCPYGGLDLSPSLFQHFADLGAGVIYGGWNCSPTSFFPFYTLY